MLLPFIRSEGYRRKIGKGRRQILRVAVGSVENRTWKERIDFVGGDHTPNDSSVANRKAYFPRMDFLQGYDSRKWS